MKIRSRDTNLSYNDFQLVVHGTMFLYDYLRGWDRWIDLRESTWFTRIWKAQGFDRLQECTAVTVDNNNFDLGQRRCSLWIEVILCTCEQILDLRKASMSRMAKHGKNVLSLMALFHSSRNSAKHISWTSTCIHLCALYY